MKSLAKLPEEEGGRRKKTKKNGQKERNIERIQKRDKGIAKSLLYTLNFRYVALLAVPQTGHGSNIPYLSH